MSLDEVPYRELQARCKAAGVRASGKAAELRARLQALAPEPGLARRGAPAPLRL